jgi:cytochrome b subunit of formate dehydrogenase
MTGQDKIDRQGQWLLSWPIYHAVWNSDGYEHAIEEFKTKRAEYNEHLKQLREIERRRIKNKVDSQIFE